MTGSWCTVLHHNCEIVDPFSLMNLWELSRIATATETICSMCCTIGNSSVFLLVLATWDSNDFVDVLDLCENRTIVFSTSESQAFVIATQLHIHHLIRELQLVYINLLDGRHCLYAAA